jgi:chitin disaccharide deacetylase
MALLETPRRLIVNADDFGRSRSINEAVIRAHREGILTSASLMVNEPDCVEAVALAKQNSKLSVGLHLSLLCGRPALPPEQIPGLVNSRGEFSDNPLAVGWNYFFKRSLRDQLQAEIHAQFARFRATGLPLDHVNGHLHMHLHPVVFKLLMEAAEQFGIRHLRLTRELFWMDVPLACGRRWYRAAHAAIYFVLAGRARATLRGKGIRHTQRVFGLLQNDHIDEAYILKLLDVLPAGDSELYSHPSLDKFKHEFEALVSPAVKARIEQLGIRLIRYQDL